MKRLAFFLLLFITAHAGAQVVLRNDFVIGKHHKLKNKGLSFISINLDRYPNRNMLINGRGGKSIVIDVKAFRRGRTYSYAELAERVYTPGPTYRPSVEPVPMFLMSEPPLLRYREFTFDRFQIRSITAPRSQSFRVQ